MCDLPEQSDLFDIAIVGAGVVGCAMARRFVLDGAKVVVLEKAMDVLDGASKGNSAILHTGFDAPPGSLEQACIAKGYAEYLKYGDEIGLPVLKSSALVLAWTEEQAAQLDGLMKKAQANGIADVEPLSTAEIRRREPYLSDQVVGGFLVPGESLIDPWTSAHVYLEQAVANGALLLRNTEVQLGRKEAEFWCLTTPSGTIRASTVINCAGLYGDVVDQRLIGKSRFAITPRKGQFVVFDKPASDLVSAILLPVPTQITKGIVVCRTIFGNVLVGPTAEDQESRTDGSTDRAALQGLVADAVRMVPTLGDCEITATYAGLRPATEYQDYQIIHDAELGYVTVGGIRSTGLSAALGIARHVADLLEGAVGPVHPLASPVSPVPERLSDYHGRDWQEPGHGGIVCHCERVTRREIETALSSAIPPRTLQGLKRRTRVTMGRCQGYYCAGTIAAMTRGRLAERDEADADG